MKKYRITESQLIKLMETAKIRPWSDEDYLKVNPTQRNDIDFDKLKRNDDEYNAKHGLSGKKARNSAEQFRDAAGWSKKVIDDKQSKLTQSIQQKYMDKTGRDTPVIPGKELGRIGGDKLKSELMKNGMKVEIVNKTFAFGNSKVPENTLIINLTSAWNCPAALNGECGFGKNCYGMGGESFKRELQKRNLRNQHTLSLLSVRQLLDLLETYIEQAPVRIKYIRISEEGDFQDQETVDFCDKMAGHLKAKYGIHTTAYTHRILDYSGLKNITINASSYRIKSGDRYFIPVSPEDWEKIPEGLDLSGKDIPMVSAENKTVKVDTTHGTFRCPCDCRTCGFCYRTKKENGEPENNMITVIETFR